MIGKLWDRIKIANEQILFYDRELHKQAHHHPVTKRLLTIPGVGEQEASSVVASVSDPMLFKNSRQFAAWLGWVPRQCTTGGNSPLGRITKQGDQYRLKRVMCKRTTLSQ